MLVETEDTENECNTNSNGNNTTLPWPPVATEDDPQKTSPCLQQNINIYFAETKKKKRRGGEPYYFTL